MCSTSTTRGKLILAGKGTEKKLGMEGKKEKNKDKNKKNGLSKTKQDRLHRWGGREQGQVEGRGWSMQKKPTGKVG